MAFYEAWSHLPELALGAIAPMPTAHDNTILVCYIRSVAHYVDLMMAHMTLDEVSRHESVPHLVQGLTAIVELWPHSPHKFMQALLDARILLPAEVATFDRVIAKAPSDIVGRVATMIAHCFFRLLFAADFCKKGKFMKNNLYLKFTDLRVYLLKYNWNEILP